MAAFTDDFVAIHHGDCLAVMAEMPPESVDAIVTDPPYGLSFMGRDWDHGVPGEHFWREALRVAKPGAHLVAFGGTRTFHRLTCAIEDAGWEVRDCLGWLYGSGFPKSLDVSKAIDKEAGAERAREKCGGLGSATSFADDAWTQEHQGQRIVNEPITAAAAAAWNGWGTALKPAWEPIILARKPLVGTVAGNVQRYGTGAINVDGCRVPCDEAEVAVDDGIRVDMGRDTCHEGYDRPNATKYRTGKRNNRSGPFSAEGRWPANIVHDGSDEVLAVFPDTGQSKPFQSSTSTGHRDIYADSCADYTGRGFTDSGSAARFFYCAKASKKDRGEGNTHPTVKPTALMRWLVRLVTPPGGTILDPFMGSGTTLLAARDEGFDCIGIDLEADHCEIAWGRLSQGVLL